MTRTNLAFELPDPAATDALGRQLARALEDLGRGLTVSLAGELGAGKTALVRALLGELGETGPVVSPSYTLVEPYDVAGRTLYHVDLYRLADPAELDFLGLRDIDTEHDWLFIEWVAHGGAELAAIDLCVALTYHGRSQGAGRTATVEALSASGAGLLRRLMLSEHIINREDV